VFTLSMDDYGSQLEQDDVATFDTIDRRVLLSLCTDNMYKLRAYPMKRYISQAPISIHRSGPSN